MTAVSNSIGTCTVPAHDGLEMVCDYAGEGDLRILFLHGWTCRRAYWRPQLEYFSRFGRIAAPDLPGHGDSAAGGREKWSVAALGKDAAACARGLDGSRVILVGHSMGGAVALEAARLLEDRALAVILADTFVLDYGGLDAATQQQIAQSFENDFAGAMTALVEQTSTAATPEPLKNRLVREMSAADPDWALPLWRDLLAWSPSAAFAELGIPIYAINGALIPESARLRCAEFVTETVMPGAGHFLQMENPVAFNQALEAILDQLR